MLTALSVLIMLADTPPASATSPRYRDEQTQPVPQSAKHEAPTDPLFDRGIVATDDPAFVRAAVETSRQGVVDARAASQELASAELRAAAQKIGAQNEATLHRLEALATARGWRLPEPNPGRQSALPQVSAAPASATRLNANFILNQISVHQATLAQYQAQIAGHGDAELKRVLRESLPGYRAHLELLLTLKP